MTAPEPPTDGPQPPRLSPLLPSDPPKIGDYWLDARLGLAGIWIAFPVAYVAMLALQSGYYLGVWRHRKIRRLI